MKKPSLIKRFFSFLLRLCVVLVLMAAIAVGSFEGVTYYLTGSFTSVKKAVKEEPAKAEPVKAEKAEPAKTAKTEKTEQKRHGTEKSVSFLRLAAAEMKIRQEIWRIHPTKCRKEGQKLARMTKSC